MNRDGQISDGEVRVFRERHEDEVRVAGVEELAIFDHHRRATLVGLLGQGIGPVHQHDIAGTEYRG
jgi:hypothetical protein